MNEDRRKGASLGKTALGSPVDRRELMVGGAAVAAGLASATPASAAKGPEKLPVQEGDRIQIVKGKKKGQLVRPEDLVLRGRQVEAFPFDPEAEVLRRKNRLNRLILLRLDPKDMDDETRAMSAEGVLAFSAICTHRGCTIKSWMPEEQHMRCHCHLSQFDALSGGSVMSGPAKRALPMVPLTLGEDRFVVATGGFTGKVGAAKK